MGQHWIFLALLAPLVYAVTNFIDKYVIGIKVKDVRGLTIFTTIMAALFGTGFWFFVGRPMLNTHDSLIVLSTGVLGVYALYFYFMALSKNATSHVVILFQIIPALSLVGAYLFLHEKITAGQMSGFILILFSALVISFKKEEGKFRLSPAFWYMLAADFLWSASYVLVKFAISANSFTKILSYESWGLFLGGASLFVFFPIIRNAFFESVKTVGKGTIGVVFMNEAFFVVAKSLTFLALSSGPVALVTVLAGTQVFYGIIFGLFLTLMFPMIFNEDISKKGLFKKMMCAVIMLVGIYLIQ